MTPLNISSDPLTNRDGFTTLNSHGVPIGVGQWDVKDICSEKDYKVFAYQIPRHKIIIKNWARISRLCDFF